MKKEHGYKRQGVTRKGATENKNHGSRAERDNKQGH